MVYLKPVRPDIQPVVEIVPCFGFSGYSASGGTRVPLKPVLPFIIVESVSNCTGDKFVTVRQ